LEDRFFVDPWSALFLKHDVNFTIIIERLKQYILKYTGLDIPIYYVCGGDRANFAGAFDYEGNCIVVRRPKYDTDETKFLNTKRVFYIYGNRNESSTAIQKPYVPELKKTLHLRMDRINVGEIEVYTRLRPYFSNIVINDINRQLGEFYLYNSDKNIISLDSIINKQDNKNVNELQISRYYDLFGLNYRGMTNRLGSEPLSEQLKVIDRKKEYYLYDDDICSGNTIEFARRQLEFEGIKIVGTMCFTSCNSKYTEVLDARDFLFYGNNNGLCVDLNEKVRLPYIYPFVCPYNRGSISDPIKFSLDIWKLNKKLYGDMVLSDFENLTYLIELLGFEKTTKFKNFCDFFIKFLVA